MIKNGFEWFLTSIVVFVAVFGAFTMVSISSDLSDFAGQASGTSVCKGSSTKSCSVSNGVGLMIRTCNNGRWASWSTCTTTSCNSGYNLINGQCVQSNICISTTEICGNGIDEDCNGSDLVCTTATSEVTSFTLINADTNNDIKILISGETIDLSTIGTSNLNIRANTINTAKVEFYLDSTNSIYRIESTSPFSLGGDNSGDYASWTPTSGSHKLIANPYSSTGVLGKVLSIDFNVVSSNTYVNTSCSGSSTQFCSVGVGSCARNGTQSRTCSNGVWSTWSNCSATAGSPTTEICGNSIDEDCNGFDLICSSTSTTPISGATFTTLWQNDDWLPLRNGGSTVWIASSGNATITIGSTAYVRSPNTKSVRFYHDGVEERVEIHSARDYLGIKEGDVVYMGWSDYHTILPIHRYTTFQWRDQDMKPDGNGGYAGCPSIQFEMITSYSGVYNSTGGTSINGIAAFIKAGKAPGGKGRVLENMKPNVWYDYVVAMKYAKDSTGYFQVWAGPAGTLDFSKPPVYNYSGPTMYSLADIGTSTEPCDHNMNLGVTGVDYFNTPQLRMGGSYQWGTRAVQESYKGPLRINVGETGQTAFNKVVPR